jgi:hypothetical protein
MEALQISEAMKQTLMSSLLAAWTWPSYVISAMSWIDDDWAVCLDRADKAGKALADALLVRAWVCGRLLKCPKCGHVPTLST